MSTPTPRSRRSSGTALAEVAAPRRLLFVSNGHGEDSIAAEIIRRLPAGLVVDAYPTLGDGLAFAGVCPVVGPRAKLASEGSRVVRGSVGRDLAGGGLATILPGLRFARTMRHAYDRIIVVGDMVGIFGCRLVGISGVVYLDVYKTGYGRLYSLLERRLIGRTAATVFSRSDRLATQLQADGVDARCAGNIMMDTISYGDYDVAARRRQPLAVALLPGSRQHTVENFALQMAALRLLPVVSRPDVFLAAAGGVDLETLATAAHLAFSPPASAEAGDAGTLADADLTVHVARGAAGNLMAAADVVLSQAGTATIQTLGLGRPVVSFTTPRDRPSRARAESALFGAARELVAPDPAMLAAALVRLLDDAGERARRGASGRERIGGPGAITAIIEAIVAP